MSASVQFVAHSCKYGDANCTRANCNHWWDVLQCQPSWILRISSPWKGHHHVMHGCDGTQIYYCATLVLHIICLPHCIAKCITVMSLKIRRSPHMCGKSWKPISAKKIPVGAHRTLKNHSHQGVWKFNRLVTNIDTLSRVSYICDFACALFWKMCLYTHCKPRIGTTAIRFVYCSSTLANRTIHKFLSCSPMVSA